MYDERIEQLISAALADGVLTEKEKQVLFKKAHAEGIDLDEFEIILDARLLEAQEAEKKKREKAAPKSDKYADVKKCPACGSIIPPNTKVCPGCGMVFSNNQEDLKEIAQLQDNYIEICNERAKFPLGYIVLSVFLLITLFNVFAWVYAIACDDLVGLPVLSTLIWIPAITCTAIFGKPFRAFSKTYDMAVAKHAKLYSTAKAFYAQDKETLNRINVIASQVDKVVAEKNKTKITYNIISYGVLCLTIVLSIVLSLGWFKNVLIRNDYSICEAAVAKAIRANDLEKAEAYYFEYDGWQQNCHIAEKLMYAYITLDEEAKVLEFYSEARRDGWSVADNGPIVEAIVNYYISKDQYQSALDVLSKYSNWEINHGLEICIRDYMKNGKKAEAQKLIKTNSYLFNGNDSNSEYYKPKVVKKLTELTRE